MGIRVEHVTQSGELLLRIVGRLELEDHGEFRDAYLGHRTLGTTVVVDLGAVTMIDSATLGMFLAMREDLGGESANIVLANCPDPIVKILKATNLLTLFKTR